MPISDKTISIFRNTTSIITGGASGIGRALAEELSRRGSHVVVADLQYDMAETVVSAIRSAGGTAEAFPVDVTDFSAVERLIQETAEQTGRIDYLFNNAGISVYGAIHRHRLDDWHRIVNINLWGVIHGVHAVYPIMRKQGFGHIVNTASMGGLIPSPDTITSYITTKHAVVGLSKSLRAEAAMDGIRVSVLCPGVIRTPMLHGGTYGIHLQDPSPQQHLFEIMHPMPASRFASKSLDKIARNKAIIIQPSWVKLLWWLNRLCPSLGIYLTQRSFQKSQKANT